MPIEYALITQFLSFTALYFIDTRAALKGWTPPWCKCIAWKILATCVLILFPRPRIPFHLDFHRWS